MIVVVAVVEAAFLPGGAPELAVAEHRLGGATAIKSVNDLFSRILALCVTCLTINSSPSTRLTAFF